MLTSRSSYYASLGALRDFSHQLVAFSHDRQSDCDPENALYYFDCLQDIANGRQSESLIIKASTLESQGAIGRKVDLCTFLTHRHC